MKITSINEQISEAKRHLEQLEATAALEQVRSDPLADPVIDALQSIQKALVATGDAVKLASLKTTTDALFSVLSVDPNSSLGKAILDVGSHTGESTPVPDVDSVRRFLDEHPAGSRSEEIAAGLFTTTTALQKVLKPLLQIGEVRKQGERRSTQYFLREGADRPQEPL